MSETKPPRRTFAHRSAGKRGCSWPNENGSHVVHGNIAVPAHSSKDRVAQRITDTLPTRELSANEVTMAQCEQTNGRADEMSDDVAYYRADVQGLNPGDATTRTLDLGDDKEYTYATTRLDVARGIAARHADFAVYCVTLDEPIEADPDAAQDNLGELFVRSPWGVVVDVVDGTN
jgi:hypothetical protein